jgi:hypothetical protein
VEFHNARPESVDGELRFDLRPLPSSIEVAFQMSENAKAGSVDGARPAPLSPPVRKGFVAFLLDLVARLWRFLVGLVVGRKGPVLEKSKRLALAGPWYRAGGGGQLNVRGIRVPPLGKYAAEIEIRAVGQLKPGTENRMNILQLTKDRIVGGATIIVPVAGAPVRSDHQEAGNEREIAGESERRGR